MNAIVYTSETGHTAAYAKLLAEKTGLPALSLAAAKKTLPAGSEVFYLGWLMAGSLKGYKDAAKRFSIRGVAAVGMTAAPNGALWNQARENGGAVDGARVFYLQGGYEGKKLTGIYRLMMRPVEKASIKGLTEKSDRSPEEEDTLALFQTGGSRVRAENRTEILRWLAP